MLVVAKSWENSKIFFGKMLKIRRIMMNLDDPFNDCVAMVILCKKVHFSLTDFIRTATPWGPYVPSLTVRRSFSGPIQNLFSGSSAYKHKHTRTYVDTRRRSNYIIYYLVYYIKSDHWPALQPYI